MRYFIITYGCQMNHSDSERAATVLENAGYTKVSSEKEADLILINSCSVRQAAIDRIFGQCQKFKNLKAKTPKLKTVLTGCILPADKKKFAEKFDVILDIKNLLTLPAILKSRTSSKKIKVEDSKRKKIKNYLEIAPKHQSPFSVNIPIMTGCNNFCSYCAVPHTRGREISRPSKKILFEAKNAVKKGAKEIWLLGQNVNSYKSKNADFAQLLMAINNIPGDFWIRFTSPHPKDFSQKLIKTLAECEKITPYLNLPLQSGDDEILRKMNRPYTARHYLALLEKIRDAFLRRKTGIDKYIAVSTDVIVGFPGETKKQFKNTVKIFKNANFDMAYISQYSPRPGTLAARMKDTVSKKEKTRRWKILTDILRETARCNNEKYVGKIVTVLTDKQKKGVLTGKSQSYKTVIFRGKKELIGNFANVKISKALPWGLAGDLI